MDTQQDGRSSKAMFRLISTLRVMREAGVSVVIDAFDMRTSDIPEQLQSGERFPSNMRDALMAWHIELRRRQYPDRIYLGFVGGVHASKTRGQSWDKDYEPMALLLARKMPTKVVAVSWQGGDAWNCHMIERKLACAAYPLDSDDDRESVEHKGYDSLIDLGKISASPPMVAPAAMPAASVADPMWTHP